MHRFFIPADWICQDEVLVKGGQARQIFQVLRLKPKDHILVLDNNGWEYEVEIDRVGGELV
jgi:16S rRNA U1498 N3-methylase RsmE